MRLLAVTFDAHDPERLAEFWSHMLDRPVIDDAGGSLLPGARDQVSLRFVRSETPRTGLNRVHLHLTSVSSADQLQTAATALELGAAHLDVGQRPEEKHIVLADPEGNEFCVIPPGNAFLAGCGFLGEVSCDGSREVGVFWSEALGWPLAWDQDEETATQSPHGGTKISWGGPPVAAKVGRNRQHFYLAPVDGNQETAVARLISVGATRLDADEGSSVWLADPDGNEFCVAAG